MACEGGGEAGGDGVVMVFVVVLFVEGAFCLWVGVGCGGIRQLGYIEGAWSREYRSGVG